jgi:hypothetical protein
VSHDEGAATAKQYSTVLMPLHVRAVRNKLFRRDDKLCF